MNAENIAIRCVERKDIPFILKVNAENVEVLAPMSEEKLNKFIEAAELFLIAEVDGQQAAFMMVLREGVGFYDSENYRWFSRNYAQFLYIDRVVIDGPYRGVGIGRKLYREVFKHALLTEIPFITAEIDTIPYNEASLKFHAAMGFKEVGVQMIRGNSVKVSLQEAAVNLPTC